MASVQQYAAHGKLLLTGEYFVLDGALALAVPTRYGQRLTVRSGEANQLRWESYDSDQQCWFKSVWGLTDRGLERYETTHAATAARLESLILRAQQLRPGVLQQCRGQAVTTHLDFPRQWGLGTSSTLVHILAQWWAVDAYALLATTFGGSGYDLACAGANGPLLYQRTDGGISVQPIDWQPAYVAQLHLVYLEQKQDSREGMARYRAAAGQLGTLPQVSEVTRQLLTADYAAAAALLQRHEELVSHYLALERVQTVRFPDFPGVVKSLGAWGGDFALALCDYPAHWVRNYFNERGYSTVYAYSDLVL